ncbi:hypothetical protein [Chelativorans salis]|uniref:Uncharacterized protein n=1 Tax=Chelativorans salis TaxID=2978478 RepID=A0ABT2LV20_9HYPH|nr:hypothetical protein [Chelativorans sp. EGI FJ00035]MCT7377428.1 hypothetical protein [Chelativorans sp. EGI FJ00035]
MAAGEVLIAVKRLRLAAVFYAVAALLGLVSAGFLVFAAYIVASARWGNVTAAVGFGVAFAVLSLAVILTLRILARRRTRRLRQQQKANADMIAGNVVLNLLPTLMARPGGVAAFALPFMVLAGYALARSIRKTSSGAATEREVHRDRR